MCKYNRVDTNDFSNKPLSPSQDDVPKLGQSHNAKIKEKHNIDIHKLHAQELDNLILYSYI